ncbi:MAG: autotransporter-associated beta strand repeat-containing protein, partial [Minisyncoccia bacterium]
MNKMLIKFIKPSVIFFVAGFLFFINTTTVLASTKTWTGSASSSWSNPTNWGGSVPSTGDDLVFPVGASNLSNTNDLPENTIINSITISGSGYTLSGNRIILGAGLASITDSASSGGNTIALDVRLDVTRDIYVTNSAETLTFSGRISGVGGINKEGTGKLVLSGANTYAGTTKINVGVINAQNNTALGTILSGTEVVGNAVLELQGNINIGYEALALRGYGVSSGGALRNISGTNSFGGLITLSSSGGTEISSDSGTLTVAGGTTGNFPLVLDGSGDITFSTTPLAGSGSITKNGAGTVRLNFPNTNTGTFFINAGTVLYGTDNALMTGAVTVNSGTLDIATYSDMVGTVTLGTTDLASGTITGSTGVLSSTIWTVYNGTISAIIAGVNGALTKSTPGTVTLTRPNLYTGTTTVSLGILKIQDSMALGLVDGATTVSGGATLQIDGNNLSIPEYITFSGYGHLYKGAIRNSTGNNTITGLATLAAAGLIKSDLDTTLT